MQFRFTLAVALLSSLAPGAVNAAPPADTTIRNPHVASVRVDSARHVVVLHSGPWDVPTARGGYNEMLHDAHTEPPQQRFTWPVTGWVRGVKLRIIGADGNALSRDLIHHLTVVNYGRRQLLYAIPERLIAIGRETEDMQLPATVGVPVTAGTPMGINFAWFNYTPDLLRGVAIELTVEWSPSNTMPRPVSVLPVHMGVTSPVASDPSVDLPVGATTMAAEHTMPLGGRIIAAGGHQHAFGTGITLDDVTDARTRSVLRLTSTLDSTGQILAMQRLLPGITGSGIKVVASHRYRIAGTYDNRSGTAQPKGAMVHLVMLFSPSRLADWPAINTQDPDWQRDVIAMTTPKHGDGGMAGMVH